MVKVRTSVNVSFDVFNVSVFLGFGRCHCMKSQCIMLSWQSIFFRVRCCSVVYTRYQCRGDKVSLTSYCGTHWEFLLYL